MNDISSFRDTAPTPVRQGLAPTPGAVARAATGALLLVAGAVFRGKVGLALAAAGGGLVYSSRRRRHVPQRQPPSMEGMATMTIDASAEELYQRWRNVENLANLFEHVLEVRAHGDGRSTWVVQGPLRKLHWESEITVDEPGRRIAWRSLPGGDVDHVGEVLFQESAGDRGTVVTVRMDYAPPGGKLGAAVAGLLGREPRQTLREDLRRLKMLVETGEIATIEGQPAGRRDGAGKAGRLPLRASETLDIVRHPFQSQEAR